MIHVLNISKLPEHLLIKTDHSLYFSVGDLKITAFVSDGVSDAVGFPSFIYRQEITLLYSLELVAYSFAVVTHLGQHLIENNVALKNG